ncbi:HAD family hydrolase [Caproicibacter sp.]|uniref:HAD family hydrolase n=1 Tax=Caproicibacter sp. TaxID=2814884 RepID=UPI00398A3FD5
MPRSFGSNPVIDQVGVIFDFNGTLFSDSDKQEKAWRTFSKQEFHRSITDDEFQNYIHGRNNNFIMQYLADQPLTENQISDMVEKKEAIYRNLCKEDKSHFHLACGAVRLLNELASRQIPRTVATASGKTNLDFYVSSFQLEKWFDIQKVIYDDGMIPGKPNPDFYIRASQAIAVPAKNCIVVEDAVSGIQAAHSAGIGKVIAICPRNKQEIFAEMPEVYDVISNFYEFDRFLLRM